MTKTYGFRPRDDEQQKALDTFILENGGQTPALRKLVDKALNMENRYAPLDDACPLRDYLGENEAPPKIGPGWFCMKKAPALTLLGSGIQSAADINLL